MTDALSQSVTFPPALTAGDVLTAHLTAQAGAFLRALPLAHGELGGRSGETAAPSLELLRTLRRVSAALHTFSPMVDQEWAQLLREELGWVLDVLTQEPACTRRMTRLLATLDSLTGSTVPAVPAQLADPRGDLPQLGGIGMLVGHPGATKARALLERQLTLARSRIHTSALQELRSARLHALADRMTLLTDEVPLTVGAHAPATEVLLPYISDALLALTRAVEALPLLRAAAAYNGDSLHRLQAEHTPPDADAALAADDSRWQQVRILVERARYALEVCEPLLGGRTGRTSELLQQLGRTLDQHQEAVDAADSAAVAARTPRITPATAYVLGVVHADQRLEVEVARFTVSHQWPEVPHSGWREWASR